MQDFNTTNLNKKANNYIFKQNPITLVFSFFYYFIKTIYSLVKFATLGISTIITSPLLFPISVVSAKRKLAVIESKKPCSFLNYFSAYFKLKNFVNIFYFLLVKLFTFFLAVFLIVPAFIFSNRMIFLEYVVAENKNKSFFWCYKHTLAITKNKWLLLFKVFAPFVLYDIFAIFTLSVSCFYFNNLKNNITALLYLQLEQDFKNKITSKKLLVPAL